VIDERHRWGKCDQDSAQGWAIRRLDRRFWSSSWSGTQGSIQRDGQVTYRQNAWRSANEVDVVYPQAVTDDFGNLVPVPL